MPFGPLATATVSNHLALNTLPVLFSQRGPDTTAAAAVMRRNAHEAAEAAAAAASAASSSISRGGGGSSINECVEKRTLRQQ